ncbi:MAG: hypothetical protein ACREGR_01105, partial [Minisyncoccia bacterium]
MLDWIGSGLAAAKPATPPSDVSGGSAFYYATDTKTMYQWDHSAGEVLAAFLEQHYLEQPVPPL